MGEKKVRVLIAKPGLDGHDRGAKVVAQALKDAGMEVIYTGLHQTAEGIVKTALEEDVDVIGLSVLSGAHLHLSRRLMDELKEQGLTDKLLLVGGNIPEKDIEALKGYGVAGVFPTGSRLEEIVEFIKRNTLSKNQA